MVRQHTSTSYQVVVCRGLVSEPPSIRSEAPRDSGANSPPLRWMAELAREVLTYMLSSEPVTARRFRIETLLDRLQRRAVSSSAHPEFVPQMRAWVRG